MDPLDSEGSYLPLPYLNTDIIPNITHSMEKATGESLRCYKHAGGQLSQRQSFSQSWGSNPLATWCKELTHWKRPWCWERPKAGEGDDRGWDGGWHHRLDGHEFEQAPGAGDGQGGLACCGSWGHKESDRTERLNSNNLTNLSDRKVPNFLRVRILRVQREIYRIKARKEKNCLKLSAITPGVPTGQVKAYQGTPMLQSHKNVRKWLAKRIRNAWQGQGTRKSP